jgi:hypothetical protein
MEAKRFCIREIAYCRAAEESYTIERMVDVGLDASPQRTGAARPIDALQDDHPWSRALDQVIPPRFLWRTLSLEGFGSDDGCDCISDHGAEVGKPTGDLRMV